MKPQLNDALWLKVCKPPKSALKRINGGRLNGMTDISPQWRFKIMTETLGPVGFGWAYEIIRTWTETGSDGVVCAFAHVRVKIKLEGEWSEPFDGIGGSTLIAKEKNGLYTSDECYKMAVTDGLSVAMKAIGVAADVYLGNLSHDSKYSAEEPKQYVNPHEDKSKSNEAVKDKFKQRLMDAKDIKELDAVMKECEAKFNTWPDAWIDGMNALFVKREKELA